MCRGHIIKPGATRAAQIGVPGPADYQKAKNGLCGSVSCPAVSTIQSLLAQDESADTLTPPAAYLQKKQPTKRPAFQSKLDQSKLNAAQAPATKATKIAPKTLRAEPEYILADKDAIRVVRIDTLEGPHSADLPGPLPEGTRWKESWQVVLDGFDSSDCRLPDLAASPAATQPTTRNEEEVPNSLGNSFIAQLLTTTDSVRSTYKKIEEEKQEQRSKLSTASSVPPPPAYLYDSGYDSSPTTTVFDALESPLALSDMETDFHPQPLPPAAAPLQVLQGSGDLNFFYPPAAHRSDSGGQGLHSPPLEVQTATSPAVQACHVESPPNVSPFFDCHWSASSPAPMSRQKQTATDLQFEPRSPLWEQQVFLSSPIFPPAGAQLGGNTCLDLESELMLAESFFDPSMDLKSASF